jgi:hypothetical protein
MRARALPILVSAVVFAAFGCSSTDESQPPPVTPETPEAPHLAYLTPAQHLTRASMALRGLRPSVEDLERVTKDPNALPEIVDTYLASTEFGATMRDLHDESLKVKIAPVIYPAGFPARGPLEGIEAQRINDAVTDAPLRLVQNVIEKDRPYSEIVTADYTMADDIVAKVWGMPYDGGGKDWRETHYMDGREHSGILSDSFLFTRHSTTYSNANRGRANAVSSSLLCYDFLTRDISIDASINLADPEEVANATKKNQACASCHQTLDPLAAYFAGYRPQFVPSFEQQYPVIFNTEPLSDVFVKAEPGYFGYAGRGLKFLGSMIAQDPRFSLCAAKRFYAYFNQVPLERVPIDRAASLQRTFTDAGMNAKKLARAIVLSDDFRAAYPLDDEGEKLGIPGIRKVRARQLDRLMEDLTGLVWLTEIGEIGGQGPYNPGRVGKIDLLSDPFFGYTVLWGGTDAYYVTRPSHSMNATATAVLRGVAQKAAPHVVTKDFATPNASGRRLFTKIEAGDTAEPAVRKQIAHLHARVYGEIVTPESAEVTATYDLFKDALGKSAGDAKRAWSLTLYAMLQDVRLAFY